jgi:hypothetical protein
MQREGTINKGEKGILSKGKDKKEIIYGKVKREVTLREGPCPVLVAS